MNDVATFALNLSLPIKPESNLKFAEDCLSSANYAARGGLSRRQSHASCEQVLPSVLVNLGNVQRVCGDKHNGAMQFLIVSRCLASLKMRN